MIQDEIGKLDRTKVMPTEPRKKNGMPIVCDICGEEIENTNFIAGFKKGHINMKFHVTCLIRYFLWHSLTWHSRTKDREQVD